MLALPLEQLNLSRSVGETTETPALGPVTLEVSQNWVLILTERPLNKFLRYPNLSFSLKRGVKCVPCKVIAEVD